MYMIGCAERVTSLFMLYCLPVDCNLLGFHNNFYVTMYCHVRGLAVDAMYVVLRPAHSVQACTRRRARARKPPTSLRLSSCPR